MNMSVSIRSFWRYVRRRVRRSIVSCLILVRITLLPMYTSLLTSHSLRSCVRFVNCSMSELIPSNGEYNYSATFCGGVIHTGSFRGRLGSLQANERHTLLVSGHIGIRSRAARGGRIAHGARRRLVPALDVSRPLKVLRG